ncbi:NAD(+) diphosphatase [Candidimonas humi]|uniref:NAD(+) diphosphatase n=1 Tax=Candidimonas humi TaxID=683355 RepID=A0ABV8NUD4_9BURK|nr:NAD(+) diphosphatase [Candidimonas humi]MBV6305009.1 NAD(+) diphosphatase [Candidimonas humi]
MYLLDRFSAIGFNLNPLDRMSEVRHDEDYVAARRREASTQFFLFAGEMPVLRARGDTFEPLFTQGEVAEWGEPLADIFLGQGEDGTALFALAFDEACADRVAAEPGLEMMGLRSIALRGLVPPPLLGEIGGANAMLNWHRRHRFCANCGAPSRVSSAGWRRDCDACGAQHFPRVDPVVIMLAIHGDRCLLGRQPRFAAGMYSALAGFLEPGETIEAAVRREIREETAIACADVSYFASQPWPFPSSLMIGCFARALDTDIVVDTTELEDARWFTRAEVVDMLAGTHPEGLSTPKPYAIAYHLLKAFAEDLPGLLPSNLA